MIAISKFVSPLMMLLTVVGGGNGQQSRSCDYVQEMSPGKQYFVYNPNYPQNYSRGSSCRWIARSDRKIKLTCDPFILPTSNRCNLDALIIRDGGDSVGQRYCGNGKLVFESKSNQLTIELTSRFLSPGGKFLCSLETETDDNSNCRCGWKNPMRIVGGVETGVNEYPMMAGLVDANKNFLFCGATIINERQVLTAAHCLDPAITQKFAVLVGDHDWTTGKDTNASRLYTVESFVKHPNYNSDTQDNDIAIVTVNGVIAFSQQVGPVCLPFDHAGDSFGGNYVDVIGWGSTELAGSPSTTLQKTTLTVIPNSQCRRYNRNLTPKQICTQQYDKDSCQYDSGGPVLWQDPSTRRLVHVGIISYGNTCADGNPAVNSRVGSYLNWIYQQKPTDINFCVIE